MKFTKPINREVDIDGHTFIVSFDDNGIDFRVKGKRKTAHVNWNTVLEIAGGEDGASASQIFGLAANKTARNEPERQEQVFAPQTHRYETGSPHSQESSITGPQANNPRDSNEQADTEQEV